ncbi:ankyrin repeat-containing domain protein, partial [Schizophyllum fasciatum]
MLPRNVRRLARRTASTADVPAVPSLGLHAAAATGNMGLVEYALARGQPVNSVLDGVLPLHAACAGGSEPVVKLLIDHGADNTVIIGTSGSTPLHFAAANGNMNIVKLLLRRGAIADRPDKHGITPEMVARQNG